MKTLLRFVAATLCATLVASPVRISFAQNYPGKSIGLVVPYSPGGGVDFVARVISQKVADSLGQQVIVDNRGGAAGILGADFVAKAAPDGYTLLIASASHSVNLSLYSNVPYDTVRDFTPVTLAVSLPLVLVVGIRPCPQSH